MGTTYRVRIDDAPAVVDAVEIERTIASVLDRIDGMMSSYDPTSELERLNAQPPGVATPVPEELFLLLARSLELSRLTERAFDPTVGGLSDLWGFGPADSIAEHPSREAVAEVVAGTGPGTVVLDEGGRTVTRASVHTRLDLSGIAKGYAVDAAAEALTERHGLERFLVELGGELKGVGRPADSAGWRVAIAPPTGSSSAMAVLPGPGEAGARGAVVELVDMGLATSGDAFDRYPDEEGGASHIIDPRTGDARLATGLSVTVVDEDVATADAWATALVVLGSDEGPRVAEREGIAALFLRLDGDGVRAHATAAFEERVVRYTPGGR